MTQQTSKNGSKATSGLHRIIAHLVTLLFGIQHRPLAAASLRRSVSLLMQPVRVAQANDNRAFNTLMADHYVDSIDRSYFGDFDIEEMERELAEARKCFTEKPA